MNETTLTPRETLVNAATIADGCARRSLPEVIDVIDAIDDNKRRVAQALLDAGGFFEVRVGVNGQGYVVHSVVVVDAEGRNPFELARAVDHIGDPGRLD